MRHLSGAAIDGLRLFVSAEMRNGSGHAETVTIGGVGYRISVEATEGGAQGSWRCGACGAVGSGRTRLSAEGALESAYAGAGAHQIRRHSTR